MFQFKPASKSGSTATPQSNGNGNGHAPENGREHPAPQSGGAEQPSESPVPDSQLSRLARWLGLPSGRPKAAPRPATPRGQAGRRLESVVGPGVSLQGTLTGAGSMRIEGSFDGTISIQGTLFVADGAKVTAEIRAGAVSVGGSVKGNIIAGKVEILSTGRVWGDLITSAFATEEGAFLRGQVRMEDSLPAPAPAAQPLPTAVMARDRDREREREAVRF